MAKVVLFPQKEKLPKGLEKEAHRIAKEYIEVLYAAIELLAKDTKDRDEMERINGMVSMAYAEGLKKLLTNWSRILYGSYFFFAIFACSFIERMVYV